MTPFPIANNFYGNYEKSLLIHCSKKWQDNGDLWQKNYLGLYIGDISKD